MNGDKDEYYEEEDCEFEVTARERKIWQPKLERLLTSAGVSIAGLARGLGWPRLSPAAPVQ